MAKLNDYLLGKAPKNLCAPAAGLMRNASVDELLELFIEKIDYSLSEEYPSKDDLLLYGGASMAKYGIYVDGECDIVNPVTAVILGKCKSTIRIEGFAVSRIYAKHGAILDIRVKDSAFVMIDCFDDSFIHIDVSGSAKVVINHYGVSQFVFSKQDQATVKVNHKIKQSY